MRQLTAAAVLAMAAVMATTHTVSADVSRAVIAAFKGQLVVSKDELPTGKNDKDTQASPARADVPRVFLFVAPATQHDLREHEQAEREADGMTATIAAAEHAAIIPVAVAVAVSVAIAVARAAARATAAAVAAAAQRDRDGDRLAHRVVTIGDLDAD